MLAPGFGHNLLMPHELDRRRKFFVLVVVLIVGLILMLYMIGEPVDTSTGTNNGKTSISSAPVSILD
jgi:hypothetical protein